MDSRAIPPPSYETLRRHAESQKDSQSPKAFGLDEEASRKRVEAYLSNSSDTDAIVPADILDPWERGIIGSIFTANILMYRTLLKKISNCKPASKTSSIHESVQRCYVRFSLWGAEFKVTEGKLDQNLQFSKDLREETILVNIHLCKALMRGLSYFGGWAIPMEHQTIEEPQIDSLIEKAQSSINEEIYSSTQEENIEAIVDALSVTMESLGDLSFCLENPATDCFALAESPREPVAVPLSVEHRAFEDLIRHRFPDADEDMIAHHGRASFDRFLRLQLLRAQGDGVGQPMQNENKGAHGTKTTFYDSGIGSSRNQASSYAKSLITILSKATGQYATLLPDIPIQGRFGKPFNCDVCFREVEYRVRSEWHNHLLEDLLPYICIYSTCPTSPQCFESRTAWINHFPNFHNMSAASKPSVCPLCKTGILPGLQNHVDHYEQHLIEIALISYSEEADTENRDNEQVYWKLSQPSTATNPGLLDRSTYRIMEAHDREIASQTYVLSKPGDSTADHLSSDANELEKVGASPSSPPGGKISSPSSLKVEGPFKSDLHKTYSTADSETSNIGAKPPTMTTKARRRRKKRARGAARKLGDAKAHNDAQSFPCPFTPYGCSARFSSKNEWKRHISTQHIKLGFWRCDLCDPQRGYANPSPYYNDFNRKDLFTQHLRRMHSSITEAGQDKMLSAHDGSPIPPVNESTLSEHQNRCFRTLRTSPPNSSCLFCSETFSGTNSWDQRIEHVGKHLQTDGSGAADPTRWREDPVLQKWLTKEGLIEKVDGGKWRIGYGITKLDSEDDDDDSIFNPREETGI